MQKQQQIFKGFVVWCFWFLCLQFFGRRAMEVPFGKNHLPYGRKTSFLSHHLRLLQASTSFKTCVCAIITKQKSYCLRVSSLTVIRK